MWQRDLFPRHDDIERFDVPDATLWLDRAFLGEVAADTAFEVLQRATPWRRESAVMFGREVEAPRLTAWFGDPGASYVYSGVVHEPLAWTPALAELRTRVESVTGQSFNSVLLNLYRNGEDSVSWHSDDEPELGPQPLIASVSLGATRVFQLKHKTRTDLDRVDIGLSHGSLLWMGGDCQRCYKHQIPKRRGANAPGPRINLTFRRVFAQLG